MYPHGIYFLPWKMTTPLIGRALLFRHLCWVLLACTAAPSTLVAASQTVTIETETDFYTVTYDDQRISAAEVREILYLSPYYPPDVPSPYFMTGGAVKEGQRVVRLKWFASIPLEQCNPGYTECAHEQLTPAFFANAQENLDKTQRTLNKLHSENLPEALEPVRAYLVKYLHETMSMEQARFNFLKTGKSEELVNIQCELCHCKDRASILQSFERIPQDKLEWSRIWHNRVVDCMHEHDTGYPIDAWNSFIKSFGIHETYRARGPA